MVTDARIVSAQSPPWSEGMPDYPFSVVTLELDRNDQGVGEITLASDVGFDTNGRLAVKSDDQAGIRLRNVRQAR